MKTIPQSWAKKLLISLSVNIKNWCKGPVRDELTKLIGARLPTFRHNSEISRDVLS